MWFNVTYTRTWLLWLSPQIHTDMQLTFQANYTTIRVHAWTGVRSYTRSTILTVSCTYSCQENTWGIILCTGISIMYPFNNQYLQTHYQTFSWRVNFHLGKGGTGGGAWVQLEDEYSVREILPYRASNSSVLLEQVNKSRTTWWVGVVRFTTLIVVRIAECSLVCSLELKMLRALDLR